MVGFRHDRRMPLISFLCFIRPRESEDDVSEEALPVQEHMKRNRTVLH